ncbi:hypothetical protein MLD38_019227 [Melastoma candidum]|uniref:Uncharacterized protein n=1 Tax=Melastoma candidum TaxID=119954 RepID=A0ACB9QVH2_9MYRT|nr:hypothetical protein MLD38_019227 [Melastoma candidum]
MFERDGETKQYGGYSDIFPIRHHGLDCPGKHVGVVGLGGLGHLAVKFAKALGAKVTVISGSENKREEAVKRLGADSFILSQDEAAMRAAMGTMHGIINTSTSATHLLKQLLDLLKTDGKLIMLGAPDLEKPAEIPTYPLFGRRSVTGSMAGSMKETQEMIDVAAKHGIVADVEVIKMEDVNVAMDRLSRGDIRYRFVIDIADSLHHHLLN